MQALTLVMQDLHDGEHGLFAALCQAADRHRSDYDIRNGAIQLSGWSRDHMRRLAETGTRYGLQLPADVQDPSPVAARQVLEKTATGLGGAAEPALVLLRDLRELHLCAARNHVNWELLSQAAKATRDARLLELTQTCQPQTVRQMRWTETSLKELSPQALSSVLPVTEPPQPALEQE